MKHLIWLGLVMLLTSCGPASKSEKYAYDLNENGCMTGQHKFSTLIDYCAALKDDELNNNCAWSLRKGTYERDCGTDWAFSGGN
jgi:hypothetical protein